jgi:hypothetical protein
MTDAGFMEATARVGRPGIQEYVKGVDFADADLPDEWKAKSFGSLIKLLRPVTEVLNPLSMKSFEGVPVTDNHPPTKIVDSTNVKDVQVGFSRKVLATPGGDTVDAIVLIQDEQTIKSVKGGKDQISLGYQAEVDFTPGVDGVYGAYDASMREIRGNHIAIVDRARAGSDFRLNDNQQQRKTEMKTRVVDNKSFELSDDAAACFDAMTAGNIAKASEITLLKTTVTDTAAALETVKGERDVALAKTLTDSDVDEQVAARVKVRIALVDAAIKVVADGDFLGKTDKEIRLEVIKKLSGGKVTIGDEATDEYVNAVYNTLVATANPKSTALGDGLGGDPTTVNDADSAREKMVKSRQG